MKIETIAIRNLCQLVLKRGEETVGILSPALQGARVEDGRKGVTIKINIIDDNFTMSNYPDKVFEKKRWNELKDSIHFNNLCNNYFPTFDEIKKYTK